MTTDTFPPLSAADSADTRNALHGYAGILGDWLKSCRPRQKHWWHASLRPSLTGLTTGVVHAGIDFEVELNLRQSLIRGRTAGGAEFAAALEGLPVGEIAERVLEFLLASGLDEKLVPARAGADADGVFAAYSAEDAFHMALALNSVSTAMAAFRAGIPEETSPIQLWPHHFDLSMIWLPGEKIPGQDTNDEEHSDKQMNFGFTFGDETIPEPYFYVTAYPFEEGFLRVPLSGGAEWQTQPFSAAILPYARLLESGDPNTTLLELWTGLLSAGRQQMLNS